MYALLLVCTMILNMIVDFMDRRSVYRGDHYALALWTMIVQFLLILPLVGLVQVMPLKAYLLCAAVGAFSAYARIPWYRALAAKGQTLSRLNPFLRLSSVISLACAFLLLGEPFTYGKAAGGGLMILGSLLMTLDNPVESVRRFIEYNKAAGLVTLVAASTAAIAVMYKYLINSGVDLFSVYFFLKLFQMLFIMLPQLKGNVLAASYRQILHLRLLVFGRVLQTIAALIYLLALSGLNLSTVEPIAALTPLLILGIELFRRWTGQAPAAGAPHWHRRAIVVRVTALSCAGVGVYLLSRG